MKGEQEVEVSSGRAMQITPAELCSLWNEMLIRFWQMSIWIDDREYFMAFS